MQPSEPAEMTYLLSTEAFTIVPPLDDWWTSIYWRTTGATFLEFSLGISHT